MRTLLRLRALWLAGLLAAVSVVIRVVDVTIAPPHQRPWGLVGLAALALAGVAVLTAFLGQLRRDRSAAANSAVRRLARLEQVVAIPFATESLEDVLPEMADRLRNALESDFATVLLVEEGTLVVKVASGSTDAADVGTIVPTGAGLVGRVLEDGKTRAWGSLDPAKVAVPTLTGGLESAAAAALVAGGVVIGVVAVASKVRSRYDDGRLAVLEFAAERLSGAVQQAQLRESERRASLGADHARRHLRLLGDASRILMLSIDDYERPLIEIVGSAVGTFASVAAVYLAENDQQQEPDLRLLVARTADDAELTLSRSALRAVTDAMAAGQSRLVIWSDPTEVDERERPLATVLHRRGMHSYVIAPIQVRGLSFGALLFATGEGVRGYRPSDRHAADELAQRVAIAAEATLLYREARANAAVTAGHLLRLRGLLDIWLDVVAARDRPSILQQAARGAARLLTPATVIVVSDGEQYLAPPTSRRTTLSDSVVAVLERHTGLINDADAAADEIPISDRLALGAHWLAAPIRLVDGNHSWVVVSSNDGTFGPEDESLLVLLCQMVATTLANAGLYQDSQTAIARLRAVFQASPAPIVTLRPDLSPSTWNPAAAVLFGWPADGADAGFPESVAACIHQLATPVKEHRGPRQRECELEQEGNTRALVLMLAEIEGERSGDRDHILVIADETERRSLARQIQRAQRMEAVGRLAGGVAHDFNNLLTVILGYADGLLRRMDEHEPNRERVEAIYRAGNRGADLTRQLLTVSRQQVADPVVLEPALVVDDVGTMMRQLVGEDIEVVRRPGGEHLRVRIDRPQLEQILLNVASNARDAMREGGRLTITVSEVSGSAVWPERRRDEGWVAIVAADTGSGMDPQTLARCLEPLFTTKTDRGGTGLGLATAYGIAAQHGGDLRIESRLGRGTTVTLLLPAVEEPVSSMDDAALPSPLAYAQVGAGTILLVDDDPDVRTMADRTLRERGFRIITAASAHEALVAAAESSRPVDILVTDVAMPGMSGAELAGLLQLSRPTPVLFISGYAERLGEAAALGDFLAKPFTPEQLVDAVSAVLTRATAGGDQGSKR